jgi:hypothetical protein
MRQFALIGCATLVISCAYLLGAAAAAKDEKPPTSGSVTIDTRDMVVEQLHKCRDAANETLQLVKCYEQGVMGSHANYTWWSSLALLYLRADMNQQAQEAMNISVREWLTAMQPYFTAGNKNVSDGQMRWVDALRFVYDDESRDNTTRVTEAVEMGLLLAKKFELEHLPSDAHSIYYEFLLQAGSGESQVMDFHRRTGNVLGMALSGPQNDTSVLWRIAEAVLPVIDGFSEHLNTKGPGPFDTPLKRMCGIEFTDNHVIKVSDIVSNIELCIEKWGNLTATLEQEDQRDPDLINHWSGSMRETALHRLAVAGAAKILEAAIKTKQGRTLPGDRFGRGMLHLASAWGQEETIKTLLDLGGDIDLEDKGKVSPRHLGCSSPGFQETFEKIIGGKEPCEKHTREKFYDEDAEDADDSGIDGGWNPRFKRPKYLHCDFDVRDASKMTQSDLMIMHTQSNHPVVLRNSFYEEDGPNFKWHVKKFNRTFGNVLVRNEFFPRQARWGIGGIVNISTLSEFLATLDVDDKKIATVNIDHAKHPLVELADQWAPPTLTNKKQTNEVDFYDPTVTVPTVHIFKRGSQSHHFVRAQGVYHAVVFGHQEWKLLPPRHARTLRGPLTDEKVEPLAQRCDLISGDVLLVPDLWSASWTAKGNGVSLEKYLYKKLRQN